MCGIAVAQQELVGRGEGGGQPCGTGQEQRRLPSSLWNGERRKIRVDQKWA